MIKNIDVITHEDLMDLFNKKILALVIHDQLKYPNIANICSLIQEQSTSSYSYENNLVSHVGNSSYEIDTDLERKRNYYENVSRNYATMQKIFSPLLTPIEYLEKDINKLWVQGMRLENFHKEKMFAGLVRIIHKGSAIHAHQDLVSWSNPDAQGINDIIGQFGVNYFLQVPEQGGELLLWNKHLSQDEFYKQSKGDFCIPISELPTPTIKIKPRVGMFIILNTHHLHAIEASVDQDRIAASCFLAYRSIEKPLTYWT